MRLTNKEILTIKEIIKTHFGEKSEIYIFGSRLDENKRGGDIDIMVKPQFYSTPSRLLAKAKLQERLSKPVDLILYTDGRSEIEKEGLKGKKIS